MNSSNYAIVVNKAVTNVIVWDGLEEYAIPAGATLIAVPAATIVDIGYSYDGTKFSAPPAA
ncbi:putative bacteriophage protein Bcep1 [Ralstonia solanacearum CMR15]|nr:putative bacteriophage protein Bcep1 [Ralstonia solanacearum CMR15]